MTMETTSIPRADINVLAQTLKPGDWLFLHGDLGAGKTFLTQQICKLLGVEDVVTSPTFSIMNVYTAPAHGANTQNTKILHLDLYRLKNPLEICAIGLEHEFDVKNSIAIFEWPSKLSEHDWKTFFQITNAQHSLRTHEINVTEYVQF